MGFLRIVVLAGSMAVLVGCYTLQPTGGQTPQPGTIIGLDLNDAGRAAMGGALGPEIGQVEGRLVERNSSEFVVAVTTLHLLRGGEQVWRGETVHIKQDYVSSIYERRFSKSRTVAMGAAGLGVVAILATRAIVGAGQTDQGGTPSDTGQTQRRPRR